MQSFLDQAAYRLLCGLLYLVRKVPVGVSLFFARSAACVFFYFSGRRRVAYADLKAAFGKRYDERARWKIVKDHFAHIAQMGIEIMYFSALNPQEFSRKVRWHHLDRFEKTIQKGKGVVLLTAHFGNWEILHFAAVHFAGPVHVLERSQKHKRLNDLLNDFRGAHGSVATSRGMGVRELLRVLKQKKYIALLGDEDAGKSEGLILPFLGRKTTVLTGPFELARRTGALVLPGFSVRSEKDEHDCYVEEPITRFETPDELNEAVKTYLASLERMIEKYPSQWFWATKRWKYSWTKRLLILSDGKPGHVKQSQAVAASFQKVRSQFGREGMEYPLETITVRYRSKWHERLFKSLAFFFIPWAQGRLHWLKCFFESETAERIRHAGADFVISSGSALVPLNLCLAKESRAKSIVLMKPGFPFNFFKYDLALIPAHDQGTVPRESFRTLLTPSLVDPGQWQDARSRISDEMEDPSKVKIGVFIGGVTRHYRMDMAPVEKLISILERNRDSFGDYVVTTSRRTPKDIEVFLKSRKPHMKGCQMMVVASEDSRSEVVPGMMALAEILIVTEDSISMISEAVSAAKKVIVLSLDSGRLPEKHRRFQELLREKKAVVVTRIDEVEKHLPYLKTSQVPDLFKDQESSLCERLEAML
ncbi:MAG: mitochondrial fission ELM1 family protein [Candidatus Omnitrophica bacterium]|nr:mitochondrial fission ELM1 family protein [Candidatus Omnitrophota bacterium]